MKKWAKKAVKNGYVVISTVERLALVNWVPPLRAMICTMNSTPRPTCPHNRPGCIRTDTPARRAAAMTMASPVPKRSPAMEMAGTPSRPALIAI